MAETATAAATTNRITPVDELPVAALGKDGRKIRTPEFRHRMVEEVASMQRNGGKTIAEACKALNLDTSSFYKWRMTIKKSEARAAKAKVAKTIKPVGRNGKTKIGPTRNEEQMRQAIVQINAMKNQGMTAKEACNKIKLGLSQYFKWKKVFNSKPAKLAKAKKSTKTTAPTTPDPTPTVPVLRVECRFCPNCGFHLTDSNNAIRRTLGVQ